MQPQVLHAPRVVQSSTSVCTLLYVAAVTVRLSAEERKAAFTAAVLGLSKRSSGVAPRGSGFDGGARPMELHRSETHDELVTRLVLHSRPFQ